MMPAPRVTTDEYLRGPETLLPQELVYGFVRDAPAPTPGHQSAVGRFFVALILHVEGRHLGRVWLSPIDVVLDRERDLVVQPDLIVVSNERLRIVTDRVWGAPDIVVEVLSPRPRIGHLEERLRWFAQYGVRECWLLHLIPSQLEIVAFRDGRVSSRRSLAASVPISSGVLPEFTESLATVLG
jgi:Uma2 family endonuclease